MASNWLLHGLNSDLISVKIISRKHSREKLKNVCNIKETMNMNMNMNIFHPFYAEISSSGISYHFQLLKLVVVEFPIIFSFWKISIVEFPTIFVIKFFSGMSLPSGPWTAKTTVPIYISRKCPTTWIGHECISLLPMQLRRRRRRLKSWFMIMMVT